MKIFHEFISCTQGVAILHVCDIQVSSFHITLLLLESGPGLASWLFVMAQIVLISPDPSNQFRRSTEEMCILGNKCANSLRVSLHIRHFTQ